MIKTAILIMALMVLFSAVGCATTANSNDNKNKQQAQQQSSDLDLGQNLYDKQPNVKTSTDYASSNAIQTAANTDGYQNFSNDGFTFYTPFAPLNPSEAAPFLNYPISWWQDYNIVTDFPTL